jgi:hypothetical protein
MLANQFIYVYIIEYLIYVFLDLFSVQRYDYIVNGEAMKEIQEYIKYEHTFAEYQQVSNTSLNMAM